ncbi:hypothetical protein PFICI_14407 [Pestalotiopsis fici W106-1]|uniref:Uncharacterized protein n=1 Tax=Pestalotiopsis fici (strain W106-1 / CGMCC3.15140) TaxID=1229662 RepID=W3WKW5_PESFW|nr:uncharacterized protein PFICI_14407 [Pestalotiopsis fici W106-1]ETS73461.1 hypothetical protein PFICI_14407 [Pestalotiopsis fici W106-1]
MFATARISILGMLPYLTPACGHPIAAMNDGVMTGPHHDMSNVHDGLTSPFAEKSDAGAAWAFTLWSGMQCTGVQVEEYGTSTTECVLASPPSYLGLANNWVASDNYVLFFHNTDCSGSPMFTLGNNTDVAGCWAPNAGEAIWSYQVKNSDEM